MQARREGAIALGIAGIIVVIIGGVLLAAIPVSSNLRAGVALVTPAGGIVVLVALAFWLDARRRGE